MNLYLVKSVDGVNLSLVGKIVIISQRDIFSVGFHACDVVTMGLTVIMHESMLEIIDETA